MGTSLTLVTRMVLSVRSGAGRAGDLSMKLEGECAVGISLAIERSNFFKILPIDCKELREIGGGGIGVVRRSGGDER